jgi:Uma2 family endonuclease
MVMPDLARRHTVPDLLHLPADGRRYQLLAGELVVTPAPGQRHQLVVERLHDALRDYLTPLGLRRGMFSVAADISWDAETLVQPDLFVVAPDELSGNWATCRTLFLAVEVISPASARTDRVLKRQRYQEAGVGSYWIVDSEARLVEIWRPADLRPEIATELLRWQVTEDAPELLLPLVPLFEDLPE